MKAPFMSC